MIGDLDISGIFLPTLLVLMGITYVLFLLVAFPSLVIVPMKWMLS